MAEGVVSVGLLRALERRVDDMSLEVSAKVSSAVSTLREELLQLLRNQQEEFQKLRAQQEILAARLHGPGENGNDQDTAYALESQLRAVVSDLRKLHQDESLTDPIVKTAQQVQVDTISADATVVLKELREEKALVAQMLDNVKQEKCEVIAMMHAFAMSKGEAMDELEAIRRTACEEAQAAASLVRRVVGSGCSSRQQVEVPSTCRSAARDIIRDEEDLRSAAPPVILPGRQGSRTSLAPTLQQQVGASTAVTVPSSGAPPPHTGGVTVLTMQNSAVQHDVLRDFVDSAQASGVGHGFYFSIMKNFYLCRDFHGKNSCMKEVLPGQHNLTDKEYLQVARQQATELWTQYGDLAEVMTDSGLGDLADLMVQLQPQAVGTPHNPFAWCGTESGHPSHDVGPGDIWNPGNGYFGSPNGTSWFAKYCDPVLFQEHIWFWEPNLHVRTLAMLIPIYHDIVGRGMVMEFDFAIDRDGLVENSHAKAYKDLGDWVRSCYGTPLVMASGTGGELTLQLRAGHVFDRFMIEEDIIMGQRVRNYTIESTVDGTSWASLAGGEAIGRKRIHLLKTPLTATDGLQVRLRISQAIATPQLKFFGVFSPCSNGTASITGTTSIVI